MLPVEDALRAVLLFAVLPLWSLAGLGDWLCHRASHIEATAGPLEPMLHLAMLGLLGPATLAALTLEINAAVLVWLMAACVLHEMVFWADLAYATRRRYISPVEQWVHCVQFAVPWGGLVVIGVLHRDQLLAIAGQGTSPPEWALHAKSPPLPMGYLVPMVVWCALVVLLPFSEELWRSLRERGAAPRERRFARPR